MKRRQGQRGPDHRKRKPRRGKIRGSAAEPAVRACLLNGGSLREAAEVLKDKVGYCASLNTLSRYARAVRAEEEGYRKLRALSEALAREPGYRLRGIARRMLQAQMLDAVAALPDLALDGVSAERLSLVLARLERAARG